MGVSQLNFSIKRGEKVGLLGPNGASKSTFVKLLTGIIKPTEGEILLFGVDPFENRKLCANNYGVVFGNRNMLWKHVPVIESFKLAADIYNIDYDTLQERLDLFDSILGISELLHVAPRKLSFGQRMKCQISYSLLHLPQIIILDEATIGLDVMVRHKVIELLNHLVAEEDLTLIITSHLIEDVDRLADRLIILMEGEVNYDGDKAEFMSKYSQSRQIKASFLTEIPIEIRQQDIFKQARFETNIIEIECEPNKVPILIRELSGHDELEDITISEPSLEVILRQVFQENGQQ